MGTCRRTVSNSDLRVEFQSTRKTMKLLLCIAMMGMALSSASSRSYYQGPRSRNARTDPLLELDQEITGPLAPIGDGHGCTGLCYIMKLERLARELGINNNNKDKRFDGYLYDFVK